MPDDPSPLSQPQAQAQRTERVTDKVSLAAPAKVTLFLNVVGRRDDGMHLLQGLVVFPDAADRITVRPALDLSITIAGPFADRLQAEDAEENLALRAAQLLRDAAGITAGAHIHLQKHIPVAAGLGGGSADAAATLRALMRLWAIPAETIDLPALALGLGADVPMCLAGASSLFAGIGDKVRPAQAHPACGLLLVNPRQGLPTRDVFAARTAPFAAPDPYFPGTATPAAFAEALAPRGNDLTAAARSLCPEIDSVLAALEELPGCRLARLCGSGATCFGLFDTADDAAAVTQALRNPNWWVRAAALPACNPADLQ